MSQLLTNKMRGILGAFGLLVVFLVAGTVDARAQGQQARASLDNPYAIIAQKIGVVACQPGTATDIQGGVAALQAQSQALKPHLADGTATLLEKVKYEYYQYVLVDVNDWNVAPEFTLLWSLPKAVRTAGNESITNQQLAGLYNATKVLFGACQ